MGDTPPKFGESGWGVSHTARKEVDGCQERERGKEVTNTKKGKKLDPMVKEKQKKICSKASGEIDLQAFPKGP